MRKVTEQAKQAFNNGTPFSKGNTAVIVSGDEVSLTLHGNKIMWWHKADPLNLHFCMCGWGSVTTRERLNGMLPNPWGISQRDGKQYLVENGQINKEIDVHKVYTINPLVVRQ